MSKERNPSAQEIHYLLALLKGELCEFQGSCKKSRLLEELDELDRYDTMRLWGWMYEDHIIAIETLKAWVNCWQKEHERNL